MVGARPFSTVVGRPRITIAITRTRASESMSGQPVARQEKNKVSKSRVNG
jgi:hypothetical protein